MLGRRLSTFKPPLIQKGNLHGKIIGFGDLYDMISHGLSISRDRSADLCKLLFLSQFNFQTIEIRQQKKL